MKLIYQTGVLWLTENKMISEDLKNRMFKCLQRDSKTPVNIDLKNKILIDEIKIELKQGMQLVSFCNNGVSVFEHTLQAALKEGDTLNIRDIVMFVELSID